jgi:(1->4)-alpha-D-glucan 1-alpha-D-glucosylmutase
VPELLRTWRSGSPELYVTAKALGFRRDHRAVFLEGDYLPPKASGTLGEHVCAFARLQEGEWVMVIVPRIVAGLISFGEFPVGQSVWGRSVISPPAAACEWRNVLTGENLGTVRAGEGGPATGGCVSQFPRSLANR